MALVIPPGFSNVGLQLIAVGDPDPWFITFGVDSTAADGDPEVIGISAMHAFWVNWGTLFGSFTHMGGAEVTVGQDGAEPVRAFIPGDLPYEGGEGDPMLPQNCALLMRKGTAVGGVRNKGRFFVPAVLPEGLVTNVGGIDSFLLSQFSDAGSGFLGTLETPIPPDVSIPMVLLHGTGISATPDPTVVTSLIPDNVISTQRRRLR